MNRAAAATPPALAEQRNPVRTNTIFRSATARNRVGVEAKL